MQLKVLSWNIWCGMYLDEVIDFLKTADADIIALQEVAEDERGNIAETIAKALGYEYVHAVNVPMPLEFVPGLKETNEGSILFGNAILSKYPIVSSTKHLLPKKDNRTIQADIKVGDIMLHVFSIHLKHSHQKQLDLQDRQAETLLALLPKERTVVMGDCNALPESTVIKKMNEVLHTTDPNVTTPTWSVYRNGCTKCLIGDVIHKLDYIFTTEDVQTRAFAVHDSKASDHLPVSVTIEI